MSPVIRANWLLLILVLFLTGLAWRGQYQEISQVEVVTPVKPGQVQSIRIFHEGKAYAQLEKKADTWIWLPTERPLKDFAWLEKLLHIAQLPSLYSFPLDKNRLADFGLAPPRYTLELNDLRLELGILDPATSLRYLRVGDSIHLISDSYTHHLTPKIP